MGVRFATLAGVAALTLLLAPATHAAAPAKGADLFKTKNCNACHQVATKVVGPAFKDVAKKYAGLKGDAKKAQEAKLVEKIMKGGKGVWGEIPMPAQPQVSKDEAKALVAWVLSQK